MNPKKAIKHFPLYKYTYEEFVRGRDGGSAHADPYNDIVKSRKLTYYKKDNLDSDWTEIYSERCGEVIYASRTATITIEKLQYVIEPKDTHCMFEYNDVMFKDLYYIPDQKCVCGKSIDSQFYNEYEDDTSVKVDLLNSNVIFHEKNCLVIKGQNVYLNGEMVMSYDEIKKEGFETYQLQNMYPKTVEDFLRNRFPEATTYKSWIGCGRWV